MVLDLENAQDIVDRLAVLKQMSPDTPLELKELVNFSLDEHKPFEVILPGDFDDQQEWEYMSGLTAVVYSLTRTTLPLTGQYTNQLVASGAEIDVPSESICIWLRDKALPLDGGD